MGDEFVGSGFAFPLRLDASGSFALVSREREIEEAIRIVVGTAPGERPLRPDFGCRVHDHVFAPADATTEGLIAADVLEALERWEPRIQVAEVDVAPDEDDPSLLYIDVRYTIQGSNDPRNLVFPFYVIPGEGGESDLLALPAADWEA